ncbi:MAG: type II toxin-antitoxin system VapC family toxin [Coriobacteriales bacterium]|jgi:predicted nucleic acid-binding protein|nr:type II toxin-antitoxin system VapC family toxin [Coriobacteriales bacterium]
MTGYLLNTNIVSELRKPPARRPVLINTWAQELSEQQAYLSVITIVEIERGLLLLERKDAAQAQPLRRWFERDILEGYAERILPLSLKAARRAAALQVLNPRPLVDTFIAATALEHNLTLVTRNVKDFHDTGVRVTNPWEPHITTVTLDIPR